MRSNWTAFGVIQIIIWTVQRYHIVISNIILEKKRFHEPIWEQSTCYVTMTCVICWWPTSMHWDRYQLLTSPMYVISATKYISIFDSSRQQSLLYDVRTSFLFRHRFAWSMELNRLPTNFLRWKYNILWCTQEGAISNKTPLSTLNRLNHIKKQIFLPKLKLLLFE